MKIKIEITYLNQMTTIEVKTKSRNATLACYKGIPIFSTDQWEIIDGSDGVIITDDRKFIIPAAKTGIPIVDTCASIEITDASLPNYINYCNISGVATVKVIIDQCDAGTAYFLTMLAINSKLLQRTITSDELPVKAYGELQGLHFCGTIFGAKSWLFQ